MLVLARMPEADATATSNAMKDATVGVDSIASMASYDLAGLTNLGSDQFRTSLKKLVDAIKAKDADLLGTETLVGQLTAGVRYSIKEANEQEDKRLRAVGLGAPAAGGPTTLVLGADGEVVVKGHEVEALRTMDAAIGGYMLTQDMTPSTRMVTFFVKGFKESPPMLRLFPLGHAVTEFNARRSRKPLTQAERMSGTEPQFDGDMQNLTGKFRILHSIMLTAHAISIAASFIVDTADVTNYAGAADAAKVTYNGKVTHMYGTRAVADMLTTLAVVEGAAAEPETLLEAYEETMKTASRYVTMRMWLNAAFAQAAQESRKDWHRKPQFQAPKLKRQAGGAEAGKGDKPGNEAGKGTDKAKAKQAASAFCGQFNGQPGGCTYGGACKFPHKCNAVTEVNGKFSVCGSTAHSRLEHIELAKAGKAATPVTV